MPYTANWSFAFVMFVDLLGILVSLILFFANRSQPFASKLLGAMLFCISVVLLNNELMTTTFFLKYPHLWRVAVPASFCVPVFSFMYVKTVLHQSISLKRSYYLLFIPALLYTSTLVPFYMLPAEQKLPMIRQIISNNGLIAKEPEGLLPTGVGIMARLILGLVLSAAQFVNLLKWKKKLLADTERQKQNKDMFRWLFILCIAIATLYISAFIITLFQLTRIISIWQFLIVTLSLTILFISFQLLIKPNILYGISGWLQDHHTSPHETAPGRTHQPKRFSLTESQQAEYKNAIRSHFEKNAPFKKRGYKIVDLAQELNIPSYHLSIFINQEFGKNFNELVNDHRVDYLFKVLCDNPEYHQYTFDALSKLAGFNSRTAFIAAVKKKTNKLPSDYFGIFATED